MKKNVLELFAGSRSLGKVADKMGMNVFSVDWANSKTWIPRPMCRNYKYDKDGNIVDRHCHHEPARRGAKTGTQGRKGSYSRSKIPAELVKEILLTI